MDDDMSESVTKVFVDLFNKGLIYRGYRMVNWDPEAKTTVSDEEVIEAANRMRDVGLKVEIFPEDDVEVFTVELELPKGTAIEESRAQIPLIDKVLTPYLQAEGASSSA